MNHNLFKSRMLLVLIFALSMIPFLIAWVLRGNPVFIKGRINKGELIEPVITTVKSDLIGVDRFSIDNIKELQGHWIMVNLVPGDDCQQTCLEAIYKTKQLLLMMNKDLTRIRRAVAIFNPVEPEQLNIALRDDNVLLKIRFSEGLKRKIIALQNGHIEDGGLMLMDPLGNLMMRYPSGFDPYKVKNDLSHLLRISQIG